jgi:hypothetical protein
MNGICPIDRASLDSLMAVLSPRSRFSAYGLGLYMLTNARWKDDEGMGEEGRKLKRGQLYVGRKATSLKLGISERTFRTAMANLTKVGFCVTQPTSEGTTVTLVHYDAYCPSSFKTDHRNDQHQTNARPTGDQHPTNEPTTVEEVSLEEGKEREEDITTEDRANASGLLRLLETKVYEMDANWLGSDRRLILRMVKVMKSMESQMIVDVAMETRDKVLFDARIPGPYLMSILESHDEDSIIPIIPDIELNLNGKAKSPSRRAYDENGQWLIERREMTLDEVRESRELREKAKERSYG